MYAVPQRAPAVEVRAAWITTNWGLDWPTIGAGVEAQKEELRNILNQLQAENFNVVLFQARAQGGVFYRSQIEPMSNFFSHEGNFDPLAFAIQECHSRGLECHAWLTTYPMDKIETEFTGTTWKKKTATSMSKPDYYKPVDDRWYLDPGRPETKNLIVSLVKEIVSNYDVDGIHFDYIRYPGYPSDFPDQDSYSMYGNGKSLQDWRRDNITQLVTDVYDNAKAIKKWVQISSSPLGRYKILPEVSRNDGWTAYETVFQDAGYWMQSGKHDLVFPMMYHRKRYFDPFLDDWIANSNDRIVVPGLGVFQMDEQKWTLQDILGQMDYIRSNHVQGQAFFRAGNILNNLKGIREAIGSYYTTPAKLPPLTWLDNTIPNSPVNLRVFRTDNNTLNLKWDAPDSTKTYSYTVYASFTEKIDLNNPNYIVATGLRQNSYSFPMSVGNFGVYYFVTASDRYHNESTISPAEFFVHMDGEK
jgi:uncharacterized lipoprotein YddW (UPF0748 family)